ncbi:MULTISPECIES: RICIN domain-containing protein [unclassified Enterococcus]|uniref:RICIN domain-containing protein n=1 Tax=unclassified Enterococcus TaxID=2608891 RepID=UPI0013E9D166|nr:MULTISPECIES: RICIN domain-containing protein [unclassified Enterococcus]
MKVLKKGIVGLLLSLFVGTIIGAGTASASEKTVGGIYDRKIVTIQSVIDPWYVVDWSQTNLDEAVLFHNNGVWNQKWWMWYNPENDTYDIATGFIPPSPNKVGSWLQATDKTDANGNPFVGGDMYNPHESLFWKLIPVGSHPNGTVVMLKNLHTNTVMDIADSQIYNGSRLITYPQHGGRNQQFIIHVEGDSNSSALINR